jgi:glycerophosphoryl diester phosphodiesterase
VIGHRGASGYRPEHTLASYRLAIRQGADYIEPDLVATKDGVLIARHENVITDTTDVASKPRFADRETTKTIDGEQVTGWFTEDFTLAELRTLRAVERLPELRPGNTVYDGRFRVPTFEQVLDLLDRHEARTGERVGVYPETKHPTYFRSIGLPLERRLVAALDAHGLDTYGSKVFLQSFETRNLRLLNRLTSNKIIQLLDSTGAPYDFVVSGDPRTYADLVQPEGLRFIARYADGIGPNKDLVIPRDADGFLLEPTPLVDDAHAEGLLVHAFTFRSENEFLPADLRRGDDPAEHGEAIAEILLFLQQGLDGFFTDFPDTGVKARDLYVRTSAR